MSNGISIKGIVDANLAVHHVDHEYLDNNPPIPEADDTLSIPGKYADAAKVGAELSALMEALGEDAEVVIGGVLNAFPQSPYIKSDAGAKLVYAKCIEGVQYTVSKTATNRFSVFFTQGVPITSNETEQILAEGYVANRTASSITVKAPEGAGYICAYIYNTSTDSEIATAAEILESTVITCKTTRDIVSRDRIDKVAEDTGGMFTYLDRYIRLEDGLIDYGYSKSYHADSASALYKLGFLRNGPYVRIKTGADLSQNTFVRISGDVTIIRGNSAIAALSGGVTLTEGHKYVLTVKRLAGESVIGEDNAVPSISVYRSGESSSVGTTARPDGDTFIRMFTADTSLYNMCFYLSTTLSCDVELLVTLKDQTQYDEDHPQDEDPTLLPNIVNWSDYAAITNSYGWVTGYTGTSSGEIVSSANFMTMFYPLSLVGVSKVKITPPTGYACSAVFYTPSGQVYGVGNANSVDHPELIDVPIEQVTVGYSGLRITVGKDNNGMSAKITDTTFIDSIVVEYASGDDDVGYYWDERYQFDQKMTRYLTEPSMVFPLITDIHFMSLANNPYLFNYSVANIKATVKKYNPDFILNLGDNTDGDQTRLKTVNRNLLMLQKFSELGVPYYHAVGNHDTNYTGGYLLTMPETFLSYYSPVKGVHFNPDTGGTEFYKDFDEYGVRLVVLNANYTKQYRLSPSTPAWVRDYALDTNNVVLLALHLSSISTQNWNGQAINYGASLTDVITNFVNNGGAVIQLCGHSHADYQFASPWLTIFSDCAKAVKANIESESYNQITGYVGSISAPDRPFGTSKEDSWSLGVYKPISKTLHLCRFGAGVDRTFHVEPITTAQTLSSILDSVTWSTSDSSIVTVSGGELDLVGAGTAAIFATDASGASEMWIVKSDA